jgi:PKD repeat protein
VTVRDPEANPVPSQTIRMDMAVDGVLQDFGTLSARTIVTNGDGKATVVFTSPVPAPFGTIDVADRVSIVATPVGNSAQAVIPRTVEIRLLPVGVILPPAQTPTPSFTFSPNAPVVEQNVLFDASTSCAGAAPCFSTAGIVSFNWRFGDGSVGSGETATHFYQTSGTFSVTLTVVNDRGIQASTTKTVTVGSSNAPTADFVLSPTTNPTVPASILFTALNVTPGAGRTITGLSWNFGDGTPAVSGSSVSHTFTVANTYTVVLTVTDDILQTTTVAKTVKVGP